MFKYQEDICEIKKLFEPLKMNYIFKSISQGKIEVSFFVDKTKNPKTSIMKKENAYYFAGKIDALVIDEFKDYLLNNYHPSKSNYIKIIVSNQAWAQKLGEDLSDFESYLYGRSLFKHSLKSISNHKPINQNIDIVEISKLIIEEGKENTNLLIDEINGEWNSLEKFYKFGFGYLALDNQKIVGWCTSEYMSQKSCGIGIEVIESYQKQNIAKAMTSAFLNKAKEKSMTPYWDSWDWNKASMKTAISCGFDLVNIYQSFLLII